MLIIQFLNFYHCLCFDFFHIYICISHTGLYTLNIGSFSIYEPILNVKNAYLSVTGFWLGQLQHYKQQTSSYVEKSESIMFTFFAFEKLVWFSLCGEFLEWAFYTAMLLSLWIAGMWELLNVKDMVQFGRST